ncbi:hypothetical protein [Gellertiella hungarica]|uniref:Uncharacterized protein n=1 Tax=Gellertiella hungarica TaxID=1572859 RepID=A0A7W6J8Y1_9HYPH|nr:hypothetical protein [Gellertiella hungarica]MBB4066137.1 hypothetical protein [Gellertiella hungarica]
MNTDWYYLIGGSTNTAAGMPRLLAVIVLYILVGATVFWLL